MRACGNRRVLAGLAGRRPVAVPQAPPVPLVLRVQAGAMPEKPHSMISVTIVLLLLAAGLLGLAMAL